MEQASPDYASGGFCEPSRLLTDEERLDYIRLLRTENVGPITFYQLLKRYGSAGKALEALPELSRLGGSLKGMVPFPQSAAEAELNSAIRINARPVAIGEPQYPSLLAEIEFPPPLIYIRGDLSLLKRPSISIVGARNGSAAGRQITRTLSRELGQTGYVIASGLARGIDTAAHDAALETGTIAVVAGGVDILYPPENADLQNTIGEKGVLLSENPPGFKPRGRDFPRRNRIISGLSHAVVVIEAAMKSGSLITARYALEQSREVFAVPGNPLDPRAEGTNRLIKNGANMTTCTDDITEVLAPMLRTLPIYMHREEPAAEEFTAKHEQSELLPADRQKIMLALGPTPTDIDELVRCTGLSAGIVHTALIELDLAGRLERHGRQKVSLIASDRQGRLF